MKKWLRMFGWVLGFFLITYGWFLEGSDIRRSVMRPTLWLEHRLGTIPSILIVFAVCILGGGGLLLYLIKTRDKD
jgi:hypothetical protein